MKKYYSTVVILSAVLVLAGCTVKAPVGNQEAAKPNSAIWKSADGGKTWESTATKAGTADISGADILSLAVNPNDPQNVFAGVKAGGILKSTDGGATWNYLNFSSEKVYGLDLDPNDGRVLYASGVFEKRGKIFKSVDGGDKWNEIFTTASVGPVVSYLVADPSGANTIYAATSDNQLIKTTDGGSSWKNIFQSRSPIVKIAIDGKNNKSIYYVDQGGKVSRSRDGGASFEDISQIISKVAQGAVSGVETDAKSSGTVYVFGTLGILVSKDSGDSWQKIPTLANSKDFPVKALSVNPANSREIEYAAAQAVYKTVDGGENWITSQFESGKSIRIMKYSASSPGVLYLGLSK
jgi:photosystem II stability/assembly factor-like uncharacterized protein